MIAPKVRALIAGIIEREGDFVNHPDDRGGPTRWGITERVARLNGYTGPMEDYPRADAELVYLREYYHGPGFDRVAEINQQIAIELTDTGVLMGPATAAKFFQRCLNAFNQQGDWYADVEVDGYLGDAELVALQAYLLRRKVPEGVNVMLAALNCLQGARMIEITEARSRSESHVYGWIKNRVAHI